MFLCWSWIYQIKRQTLSV